MSSQKSAGYVSHPGHFILKIDSQLEKSFGNKIEHLLTWLLEQACKAQTMQVQVQRVPHLLTISSAAKELSSTAYRS
jgi:hypothetical protein